MQVFLLQQDFLSTQKWDFLNRKILSPITPRVVQPLFLYLIMVMMMFVSNYLYGLIIIFIEFGSAQIYARVEAKSMFQKQTVYVYDIDDDCPKVFLWVRFFFYFGSAQINCCL